MKLICTITGAEVEASEKRAKRLIASGVFEAVAEKPKRTSKKAADKE